MPRAAISVTAWGATAQLLAPDRETLERVLAALPPAVRVGGEGRAARTLELVDDGGSGPRLVVDGRKLARFDNLEDTIAVLSSSIETLASTHSDTHAFLHAGAVEVGGRAVMLPGRSHAGKTTLVRALLERGARYLSDDLVPIDAGLRAHPLARPLMVRAARGAATEPVPPERVGSRAALAALEIAAVFCVRFDPAEPGLRLEEKTDAASFAALLAHAPGAQIRPDVIVPILAGIARRTPVFVGARGEAGAAADALLARLSGSTPDRGRGGEPTA